MCLAPRGRAQLVREPFLRERDRCVGREPCAGALSRRRGGASGETGASQYRERERERENDTGNMMSLSRSLEAVSLSLSLSLSCVCVERERERERRAASFGLANKNEETPRRTDARLSATEVRKRDRARMHRGLARGGSGDHGQARGEVRGEVVVLRAVHTARAVQDVLERTQVQEAARRAHGERELTEERCLSRVSVRPPVSTRGASSTPGSDKGRASLSLFRRRRQTTGTTAGEHDEREREHRRTLRGKDHAAFWQRRRDVRETPVGGDLPPPTVSICVS